MTESSSSSLTERHTNQTSENRRLGYKGNIEEVVRIQEDSSSHPRYEIWKRQLKLLEENRPLTESVLAEIVSYEPRLNKMGYSVLHPGERFYSEGSDIFGPWLI
jgi:hypothetical protein